MTEKRVLILRFGLNFSPKIRKGFLKLRRIRSNLEFRVIINSTRTYSKPSLWHILKSIRINLRRIKFKFRPTQIDFIRWFLNLCATNKGVNPPRLQILRIDGDWVIDDVIVQGTWRYFLEKNARKRCCFNCNIWPNWFTFHQSHYCLSYNGIPECVWKRSLLTEK